MICTSAHIGKPLMPYGTAANGRRTNYRRNGPRLATILTRLICSSFLRSATRVGWRIGNSFYFVSKRRFAAVGQLQSAHPPDDSSFARCSNAVRLVRYLRFHSRNLVYDHRAALHYKYDLLQGPDVGRWISLHGYDVRVISGLDRAHFI